MLSTVWWTSPEDAACPSLSVSETESVCAPSETFVVSQVKLYGAEVTRRPGRSAVDGELHRVRRCAAARAGGHLNGAVRERPVGRRGERHLRGGHAHLNVTGAEAAVLPALSVATVGDVCEPFESEEMSSDAE